MINISVKGFKLSNGTVEKYSYSALDNIITDDTLTLSGVAADGKAVGEELTTIRADLEDLPFTDVTSASDMSDTTKIYRYNGALYFYDGSAWTEVGTGSGSNVEIYVQDDTSLVINTNLANGNEVSY